MNDPSRLGFIGKKSLRTVHKNGGSVQGGENYRYTLVEHTYYRTMCGILFGSQGEMFESWEEKSVSAADWEKFDSCKRCVAGIHKS